MSIEFSVGGFYSVSSSTFWQQVFFDEAYTQSLMLDGLGHQSVEVRSLETGANGVTKRQLKVQPSFKMPSPVKRLLGDGFFYIEDGVYDPANPAFISRITVPTAPSIIEINTTLSFVDRGNEGADRHVSLRVTSSKFGLARLIESSSKGILTQQYKDAELFTQRWLKTHLKGD